MCGLVGIAGDITAQAKGVFNELLLVDVVRGHHSTGAAAVLRDNSEIAVAKLPIPSQPFIASGLYQGMIGRPNIKCLIGHNRYATIGDKTIENAHPFAFENLVGAHNGTLDRWVLNRFEGDFGTDSETLYNAIHSIGVKKAIEKLNAQSAWALTWYDRTDNTMNMLRNNRRPLSYCYSDDRRQLLWASEPDMLEWVMRRNNIKPQKGEFYECEADTHYRWELPEKPGDKFDKPVVVVTKPAPFSYGARSSYGGRGQWEAWDYEIYGGSGVHSTVSTSTNHRSNIVTLPGPAKKHDKIDTTKFRPPYKDAKGVVIPKADFFALTKHGCAFCDDNSTAWGEFIHVLKDDYDGRRTYLCETCYNDEDIYGLIDHIA